MAKENKEQRNGTLEVYGLILTIVFFGFELANYLVNYYNWNPTAALLTSMVSAILLTWWYKNFKMKK